jgi:predicted O-methyltransferase YrrM
MTALNNKEKAILAITAVVLLAGLIIKVTGLTSIFFWGAICFALIMLLYLVLANVQRTFTLINHKTEELSRQMEKLDLDMKYSFLNEFKQIESLMNVRATIDPDLPIPNSRGWAASPDVLNLLVNLFTEKKPQYIIEAGSGISTIVFASLMKKFGINGKIYSLDHDAHYAGITMDFIKRHGLENYVEILVTDFKEYTLEDAVYKWYNIEKLSGIDVKFDMAFVDGPPTTVGNNARYPFYPLLKDKLNSNCVIVLDDAVREDEKEIIQKWTTQEMTSTYYPCEKGAHVLITG